MLTHGMSYVGQTNNIFMWYTKKKQSINWKIGNQHSWNTFKTTQLKLLPIMLHRQNLILYNYIHRDSIYKIGILSTRYSFKYPIWVQKPKMTTSCNLLLLHNSPEGTLIMMECHLVVVHQNHNFLLDTLCSSPHKAATHRNHQPQCSNRQERKSSKINITQIIYW